MKIITKNYILKKLTMSNANINYLKWFKDKTIKKYIDSSPSSIEELKSYIREVNKNSKIFFWGIFKKKKHIGNIKIYKINLYKKIVKLGILIGEKKFRKIGVSYEVIDAIKKFLIKKNFQYIYLGVNKKNIAAISSYKKNSFIKFKSDKKNIYMRSNLFNSKLIIGGAQLNSNYGITNFKDKILSKNTTKKIINIIKKKNIRHIDGAETYKLFRENYINILKGFQIDTKIFLKDILTYSKLKKYFKEKYLNKNIKIDTLFIHDGDNIFKNSSYKKIKILQKLKKNGIVSKIGISIYNFKILRRIILKLNLDVIQVPYNLVDRRIEIFKKIITDSKIKIYARSIFLQGSFLKKVKEIKELSGIYEKISKFSKKIKETNFDVSLNFVSANNIVDKIIVGVRSVKEIKKLVNFKIQNKKIKINFNKNEKIFAHNPSKWK